MNAYSRGQSLYYALLFSSEAIQEACYALTSFFQEITSLTGGGIEPSIAKAKLLWWQTEIARTYQQIPQHPVSKQLQSVIEIYDLPEKHFEHYLAAALQRLDNPHLDTWEAVQAQCRDMGGLKILLMARVMKATHPDTDAFAIELGSALELIDRIRYFGKDLSQNNLTFAKADLDFFNINEQRLFTHETPQDLIASLLYRTAHRARLIYQKALEILPENDRFKVASLLNLAKIYFALLDEVEQANFDVLNQRISLTPLRKWWLAWRNQSAEKQRFNTLQKLINEKVTVHG
ncbi:MAG: squalene/phytoene synthase family protein [Candidatus Berkiella sp.]